jgi:hypothetical protein
MKIVERREHDNAWWGRTPDNAWFRWNTTSVGWEGPFTPPWPAEPGPLTGEEEAIVAAALATTAPGGGAGTPPGPPMNRVDAWWNRQFPPFSKRRLMFGVVALPMMAAIGELLFWGIGWHPSLPRYLFTCIAGGMVLSSAWLPGMREVAERLQRARGTRRSPWSWRRAPEPEPPLPPIERNIRHDFLVALPFSFAIVLVMSFTVVGPGDTFSPVSLLTNVAAALFTGVLVALRTSVWGLALFSIAGGLLGGLVMLILSAMTFSDPGGDFLIGWAIGSVLLFLYAYPVWRGLRNLEARGFRLPMWIVMGSSVLLVSGTALMFVFER